MVVGVAGIFEGFSGSDNELIEFATGDLDGAADRGGKGCGENEFEAVIEDTVAIASASLARSVSTFSHGSL